MTGAGILRFAPPPPPRENSHILAARFCRYLLVAVHFSLGCIRTGTQWGPPRYTAKARKPAIMITACRVAMSWAARDAHNRGEEQWAGRGSRKREMRRSDVAGSQEKRQQVKAIVFFSQRPPCAFACVEAYAHISGGRPRPRLRLRLRGGNHPSWADVVGESAPGIANRAV